MSGDIFFCASNEPPPPVAEVPGDWKGQPLGSLKDVRTEISSALPSVDWSDPSRGIFEGADTRTSVNIGRNGPFDSFMVHVRDSEDAVGSPVKLAHSCRWHVVAFSAVAPLARLWNQHR